MTAVPLRAAQIAAIIPAAPPPITVSCLFILDLPENAEAIPDVLQLVEGRGDVRSLLVRGGRINALSILIGAASESTNEIISLRTSSEPEDI